MHNYDLALSFAEQHAAKEPSRQAARKLVELIPEAEAAAFGLPGKAMRSRSRQSGGTTAAEPSPSPGTSSRRTWTAASRSEPSVDKASY
jgi:hypothetical protein